MNRVKLAICLMVVLHSGCEAQNPALDLKNFNVDARKFFQERIDPSLLKPLTERDACLFTKVIANDLDELNNWKTTILFDRFIVRKYFDPHLSMSFSFVKDVSANSM